MISYSQESSAHTTGYELEGRGSIPGRECKHIPTEKIYIYIYIYI
jgi:hypothetical protein